jgi:cytochrome c
MTKKFFLIAPAALAGLAFAFPAAAPAAAQAAPDGSLLFRQRCGSCHSVDPAVRGVLGPNLAGLAGRKAGATAFNYSPALKASNLTWDKPTLERFLAAPGRTVPGTRMVIALTDGAQRTAVINFLAGGKKK